MKRLTFTGVIETYEDVDNPVQFVEMALKYGNKHQDFFSYSTGKVTAEDMEEE